MTPLRSRRSAFALTMVFALGTTLTPPVSAQQGPGLGQPTWPAGDLFKVVSRIRTTTAGGAARGNGNVAMHNGYLVVGYAPDSGRSGGGFSFWNVSNPRSPQMVFRRDETALREPHGFGFSYSYPGKYVVLQAINGIQFWDWTNVTSPVLLNYMRLAGVAESDYASGAWWCFFQAPYVYVGGSGNGIYVINATDPRNPVLVRRVPTSATGGFRTGPVFAIGNLLVTSGMDVAGIATLDISDPGNPTLLARSTQNGALYSALANGNRIYVAGNNNRLHMYDITNPSTISFLRSSPDTGDKGGYVTVQDTFVHMGSSGSYRKIRQSDGSFAGSASKPSSAEDWDFATAVGNWSFIGQDHSGGSPIVPHQSEPDTTPPAVNMVNPAANAVNRALTSRVGVTLTDQIDLDTVNSSTFIVRPVGGSALAGKYSGQSGILNFFPNSPLQSNTTYEVLLPAGGVRDWSGNAIATAFSSRFSTGGTIGGTPPTCTLASPRTAVPVNTSVSFSPGSTGNAPTEYSWNFGDGTTTPFGGSSSATHTYTGPGHYTVQLSARNSAGTGTCAAVQTVHRVLPATAPTHSSTIAFDAAANRVWAVNADSNTVTAINASTLAKAVETTVGSNPKTVAVAPDGRIWVTNQGSATISVLNGSTGAVAQTISLPRASRPYGVAFAPNDSAAFVTLEGTGQLVKLNPNTGAQQGSVSVGPRPRGIAISGDSQRVLVTRFISPSTRGEIVDVNGPALTVTRTIALANDPGPDREDSGRGIPNYISSITISPDGTRAWIPSKKDNLSRGLFRDGQALDFESTVRTIVSQINLSTNAEDLAARKDLNDRDLASAVVFSPIGDWAFVATQGTNNVEVLDAYTRAGLSGMDDVGRSPQGMVLIPSGRIFVQNFMGRTVSVYDVSGILNSSTNVPIRLAEVATVANELLSPTVLLGKRIFYNADDDRMNHDKYISCASCHLDGGADGHVFDFTDRGEGLRNTVELNGRRGTGHGNVHWTANFDEIQDFEHDMRGPFQGTGFMTDAQFNTGTRNQPLGQPKAGISPELDALAAYVGSLNAVHPSPNRNADGSLTADGVAGRALFIQLQCFSCHGGPDFTDRAMHNVGTIKPSSGKRLGGPLTGIDTPTLKGTWETAPYLHDGSAATMMDVFTTQNTSGQHGDTASLTDAQRQQLVAYMLQIDESDTAPDPDPTPTPSPTPTGGTPTPTPTPTATPTPTSGPSTEITPGATAVTASTSDANVPANTIDNNLATRWSANGDGQWIRYDLGTARTISHVQVAVYQGNARQNIFDLQVSNDNATWSTVFSGRSTGTTTQEEMYDFTDVTARWIRYLGHSNTVNSQNSVTEISIFGGGAVVTPTPTPTPTATPTPPTGPVVLPIEAESAPRTAPMVVASDAAASGGQYVHVVDAATQGTPPTTGFLTFNFNAPAAGTYRLWVRVISPTDGDDSVYVRMDSGTWFTWNEIVLGSAWHWDNARNSNGGNAVITWALSAGAHTLTIAHRENGTRLDRIVITSDAAYVPTGMGP